MQPGRHQVVHEIGGGLGVAAEESFENQHAVAELALVLDLALVGEQVVTQVHAVGERVPEYLHRPGRGDLGGHLGTRGMFDQIRRPGCSADLASHLDVFDGVGDPVRTDVGEFPQGFIQQVRGAVREPTPPVR